MGLWLRGTRGAKETRGTRRTRGLRRMGGDEEDEVAEGTTRIDVAAIYIL